MLVKSIPGIFLGPTTLPEISSAIGEGLRKNLLTSPEKPSSRDDFGKLGKFWPLTKTSKI